MVCTNESVPAYRSLSVAARRSPTSFPRRTRLRSKQLLKRLRHKERPDVRQEDHRRQADRFPDPPSGRSSAQTLIGLGLNKMHKTRELEDTPSVRGMVNKIPHLVEIIEERG